MKKFKVVSWRDYHGVETVFRVVDQYGDTCGVFPSEWEAERKARELEGKARKVAVSSEEKKRENYIRQLESDLMNLNGG